MNLMRGSLTISAQVGTCPGRRPLSTSDADRLFLRAVRPTENAAGLASALDEQVVLPLPLHLPPARASTRTRSHHVLLPLPRSATCLHPSSTSEQLLASGVAITGNWKKVRASINFAGAMSQSGQKAERLMTQPQFVGALIRLAADVYGGARQVLMPPPTPRTTHAPLRRAPSLRPVSPSMPIAMCVCVYPLPPSPWTTPRAPPLPSLSLPDVPPRASAPPAAAVARREALAALRHRDRGAHPPRTPRDRTPYNCGLRPDQARPACGSASTAQSVAQKTRLACRDDQTSLLICLSSPVCRSHTSNTSGVSRQGLCLLEDDMSATMRTRVGTVKVAVLAAAQPATTGSSDCI